jgi:hypothetical protein
MYVSLDARHEPWPFYTGNRNAAPVRAEKKQIAFPHFSSTGEIPRALFYFLIGSSGIVIHASHAHVKA